MTRSVFSVSVFAVKRVLSEDGPTAQGPWGPGRAGWFLPTQGPWRTVPARTDTGVRFTTQHSWPCNNGSSLNGYIKD